MDRLYDVLPKWQDCAAAVEVSAVYHHGDAVDTEGATPRALGVFLPIVTANVYFSPRLYPTPRDGPISDAWLEVCGTVVRLRPSANSMCVIRRKHYVRFTRPSYEFCPSKFRSGVA